jgi:hypothetical protein
VDSTSSHDVNHIMNLAFGATGGFFKTRRTSPAPPFELFEKMLSSTHTSLRSRIMMSLIRKRIKLHPVLGTTLTAGRISLVTIRPFPHWGQTRESMPVSSSSKSSHVIDGFGDASWLVATPKISWQRWSLVLSRRGGTAAPNAIVADFVKVDGQHVQQKPPDSPRWIISDE